MVSFVSVLQLGAMLAHFALTSVLGHGFLWDPPGRSTMWRQGFKTPENYNDMELWCGGKNREISNGYKCGVCGDPYDGVRENEEGGKYATGIISRTYQQGQHVTVQVNLTQSHKGYFEFKLCPKSSKDQLTTQECLDQHPLALADGTGSRYQQLIEGPRMYDVEVVLPAGVTCDYCVMQWRYHEGKDWGIGPDGIGCLGCGYEEEFYNCADVRIVETLPDNSTVKPNENLTNAPVSELLSSPAAPTTESQGQVSSTTSNTSPTAAQKTDCKAFGLFAGETGMDAWCAHHCALGDCPKSQCTCN